MTGSRVKVRDLAFRRCRTPIRSALYGLGDMFAELTLRRPSLALRPGEFWALQDVHLDVSPGEALGIVGLNGAGKSTLAKLLGGLLSPERGSIEIIGHAETIVELGSVLDPLLSGRENAAIGAQLRHLKREDIGAYVADVESFAEIGSAFDAPVCTYSSGMQARVAFSLAVMGMPDLLVIDEALAVGDHAFQRRCVRFINALLERGGSLILISHNNFQIQSLCERGMLLHEGQVAFSGSAIDAVRAMLDLTRQAEVVSPQESHSTVRLVRFMHPSGGPATTGQPAELVVEYSLPCDREDVSWGFEIWTADEQVCILSAQDMRPRRLEAGRGRLSCTLKAMPLVHGRYVLRVNLADLLIVAPIALSRFGLQSEMIDVQSPASIVTNFHIERGQITTVDVDWSRTSSEPSHDTIVNVTRSEPRPEFS